MIQLSKLKSNGFYMTNLNVRLMALILLLCSFAQAELVLPAMFTDHMILQRDIAAPVWGKGTAGETVTVEFAGQSKTAKVEADGKWILKLDPLTSSSEGRELSVKSSDGALKVQDVLVGEVWVASGQSNMDVPVGSVHNATEALASAEDPQLRFFKVTKKVSAEPLSQVVGKWEASSPELAKSFSGVAYFFARDLRSSCKCPVGILQAAWGGTSIHCWTSLDGLKKAPPLQKFVDQWEKAFEEYVKVKGNPQLVADYDKELKQWQTEVAPAYNAELKAYNEAKAAGKDPGKKPQPPKPEPNNPDPMAVPSPSRRPSTPSVIYNGMISPLVPYAIRGYIWYQGENDGGRGLEYREQLPRLIEDWRAQWKRGLDAAAAELSFIIVQLPCNGPDPIPVADKGWPWLREAQLMALKVPKTGMAITLDVGNPKDVHPADKLDVGKRLALVARKLSYGESIVSSGPLYQDYKIEGKDVKVRFREIGSGLTIGQTPYLAPGVVQFPTDKLIGFYIAGEDKQWVEAEARIEGDTVIVSSPQVAKPVAARYGWANSPRANLYNKEELPASPFRTDDWP